MNEWNMLFRAKKLPRN